MRPAAACPVALDGVRDLSAVRRGQRGGGVRAVVRRERTRVAEHRLRRGQRVVVGRVVRGVVQTRDGQDGTVQAVRRGGGLRGRPVRLLALGVIVQLRAEGLLGGGHVTGDRDVVGRDAGDREARRLQPRLDSGDLGRGGPEALLDLRGGEVLAVRGGRRVGDGLRVRGQTGGIPAGEVDPGGHLGTVGRGSLVRLGGGPRGPGAGERVPAWGVRGMGRGNAERQRAGEQRQCRCQAHTGALDGAVGSHGTP